MPCPLYQNSTSENPLRVCGPKNRIDYAPSSAHLQLFCLSISAYQQCPIYKQKASNWRKANQWDRFFKLISDSFLQKRKVKKDKVPHL
jgi:hypothetical protein